MRKQKIEQYEYILNEREMKLILECLRYCRHRFYKHDSSGIRTIGNKAKDLCNLIEDFE